MISALWIVLAAVVAAVGLSRRATMRKQRGRDAPLVDDHTIRRILDVGTVEAETDEPLDLDEVARAEEEFWNEDWDEPEEFGR